MGFNSLSYYVFLIICVTLFYFVPYKKRNFLLLIASYIFYCSFDYRYSIFILITTLSSFYLAQTIEKSRNKQFRFFLLSISLLVEFSMLFSTKYFNQLSNFTGLNLTIDIITPLGISFYTFQTIGYMFDVYRKNIKAESSFLNYATFLCFFPHLLAGPIEPSPSFLSQLKTHKVFSKHLLYSGILLILLGLFKKLVIADRLNSITKLVFTKPQEYSSGVLIFTAFLARYQIYCDFSGYTDIALGSAQLFGIQLMQNFRRPFFSTTITEYWQRWHISLTKWIQNYLFFPMASTRLNVFGTKGLILITFLFLGLWHGGTFNFILYGLLNALLVILELSTRTFRNCFYTNTGIDPKSNFISILGVTTTFSCVALLTILFYSSNIMASLEYYQSIFSNTVATKGLSALFQSQFLLSSAIIGLIGIVLFEFFDWKNEKKEFYKNLIFQKKIKGFLFATCMILLILFFGYFETNTQFIYFNY